MCSCVLFQENVPRRLKSLKGTFFIIISMLNTRHMIDFLTMLLQVWSPCLGTALRLKTKQN